MQNFNAIRVGVIVLGLAALAWTLLCPWWLCRTIGDADLLARIDEFRAYPNVAVGVAYMEVKMVPLWRISSEYGFAELLPFNAVQLLGIAALWVMGMLWARQWDMPGAR